MTSTIKSREIQIPIESLRRGLFVSTLDRDWSETPFAFQGFLIEADHEIEQLRKLCEWVAIDPLYSDPAAVRTIIEDKDQEESPSRARRATARTTTGEPTPSPRGEPVPWLHRLAAKLRKPTRKRKPVPPTVALPDSERSPLVPRNIPLVRYRTEVP